MKRNIDFFLSVVILIFFLPVMLIIALIIKLKIGSPVLFKQERPGYKEEPFTLLKFRTMTTETDNNGDLLGDRDRSTKVGNVLRSLSLDELPQLLNVLRGDLSLVGPRPLLMSYLPLYTKEQHKRHDVKPGITGWAQINGRNTINWEKTFDYDIYYVHNQSLKFDIKILLLTVKKVLLKEGIQEEGQFSKETFKGGHQTEN